MDQRKAVSSVPEYRRTLAGVQESGRRIIQERRDKIERGRDRAWTDFKPTMLSALRVNEDAAEVERSETARYLSDRWYRDGLRIGDKPKRVQRRMARAARGLEKAEKKRS